MKSANRLVISIKLIPPPKCVSGYYKKSLEKKFFFCKTKSKNQQIIKTMVKLNKKQLGEAIKEGLREENGLNEIFKMTLEGRLSKWLKTEFIF